MGAERVVQLGRALRDAGVAVGTGRLASCAEAATLAPGDLYWVGRITLLGRRDDIAVYDRVFRELFGTAPGRPTSQPPRVMRIEATMTSVPVPIAANAPEIELREDPTRASATDQLRERSFASLTDEELAALARTIDRLRLVAPIRRTRRRGGARRGELDLRRTVRRALRTGGDPVRLARRVRRTVPRRVVLVLDISGSMASYSRALLIFAHAALAADARWEAFTFGTRLTRLSGALRATRADDAIRRASELALDWDGGTRIGQAIGELLSRHGGDVVRGSVVIVLSDGLDVGEPELLATQMARLHRLAHRVVWLNPLRENPRYQPLARGMAAALPHIDLFASGHNLVELEAICAALPRL